MDERLAKIQEHARQLLEKIPPSKPAEPLEPEIEGDWRQLTDRKWEFRKNGIVLATIFHKPINNKFSLWFKTPDLYAKTHMHAADTYLFDTREDAMSNFLTLLEEHAGPWVAAVNELLNG